MIISRICKTLLCIAVFFICSCANNIVNNNITEKPPYVITQPLCEIEERPGYFTYAGITFKFLNKSEKIADKIKVSFSLFDANTKGNPFVGSNMFEITMLGIVSSNENKEILISLDKYITVAPETPYLIDLFYIQEIHYTDGSTWEDKYGIHKIK